MAAKRGRAPFSFDFKLPYLPVRILWGEHQRALKIGSSWVINWQRTLSDASQQKLLSKVNKVINPFGCIATGVGPNSVGVQGDGRVYWPCVFIVTPQNMEAKQIAVISNKITNEVPGISKVLVQIS